MTSLKLFLRQPPMVGTFSPILNACAFICILVAFFATQSFAATYTVGPGAGTTAATFTALMSAHTLQPDDIVEFQARTAGGSATFSETISPNGSGAAGHPIIIRARPGDSILIDAEFIRSQTIYVSSQNYITFDGLHVDRSTGVGFSGSVGINGGSNIIIQNCSIHVDLTGDGVADRKGIVSANTCNNLQILNNTITIDGGTGSWGPGETDGMLVAANGLTICGNKVTMHNAYALLPSGHNDGIQTLNSSNILIEQNVIDRNVNTSSTQGQGIYVEWYNLNDNNVTNYGTCIIRNNLVFGNGGSYLVQTNPRPSSGQTKDPIADIEIYNNVIDAYNYSSSLPFRVTHGGTLVGGSLKVINNIFIARRTTSPILAFALDAPYPSANLVIDYNHIYPAASTSGSDQVLTINGSFVTWAQWQAAGYDTNGIGYGTSWASPNFKNFESGDYNLIGVSPDTIAGKDLSASFPNDLTGTKRMTWDIGAYYFSGTASPRNARTNTKPIK